MSKIIALTNNQVAEVDDSDWVWLRHWQWSAYRIAGTSNSGNIHLYGYKAGMKHQNKKIWMHNVIMNPPEGFEVDHINRNPLDNRRSNLRIVTHQANCQNRMVCKENIEATSKFIGVRFKSSNKVNPWQASYSTKHLGYFPTEIEAAKARDEFVKENIGVHAVLNMVEVA